MIQRQSSSNSVLRRIRKFALPALAFIALSGCEQAQDSQAQTSNSVAPVPRNLSDLSAAEIVPILQAGEVTVEAYAQTLLEQAQRYGPSLNAFITIETEAVLAAARAADAKRTSGARLGPLFGVPISFKDIISTKDLVTTFGTARFAGYKPSRSAPLVTRLQEAGAIIFGKNNAQELAYGSNGYNAHYGQQLNPYNTEHIAGGSTGGGAAAVAARIVPIAIGSDTAASIRGPAAFNGLFGLRPTTGRYDNSGVSPIAPTLDTVGPLTRSADDLVLIDSVLTGDFKELPVVSLGALRLGVPRAYFHEGISTEMASAFAVVLDRLKSNGVTLVEVDLQGAQALTEASLYPILFYETYPSMVTFLREWGDGTTIDELHAALGWDIKLLWDAMVMPGAPEAFTEEVYRSAVEISRPALQANYDEYFENHDLAAMIFPATADVAPLAKPDNPQETVIDGETVSLFINDNNSSPGALAGQPGVVLPVALSKSGLPLAVSLDGRRGDDRHLLAIARALAEIIPPIAAPQMTSPRSDN